MRGSLFLILVSFGSMNAHAASETFSTHGMTITVEPMVSYQRLYQDLPTRHAKFMMLYGARATIGHPQFSGEAEYQTGEDTSVFPLDGLTTHEKREQLKLGLRSRQPVNSFMEVNLRAGGQASRMKYEEMRASGITHSEVPLKVAPYVGVGLGVQFMKQIGLVADFTFTLPDYNKPSEIEVQSSVAFRISLGK